jgi:nucleoside 2-deoxyribosyltransferase
MNIYVASSWRNRYQQEIVSLLRDAGHEPNWMAWSPKEYREAEIVSLLRDAGHEPKWMAWSPKEYREALRHPTAQDGFRLDMENLRRCDCCILVLPSGRSAHLEAGWAAGAGKPVLVFDPERVEPEPMYGMCSGGLILGIDELFAELKAITDAVPSALPAIGSQSEFRDPNSAIK